MTPELETLERVLAEVFREVSTAARLADMAGLDVVQIDRTGSSADVWHSIITMAMQDGVLDGLIERAKQERPRNAELAAAWKAYQAAQLPAPSKPKRPPRGQAGEMSDNRNDERRDARVDQMQRDIADMRVQMAGLVVQVAALTEMVRKQSEGDNPSLSNAQFVAIMVAFGALAIIVFAAVYYGGNR